MVGWSQSGRTAPNSAISYRAEPLDKASTHSSDSALREFKIEVETSEFHHFPRIKSHPWRRKFLLCMAYPFLPFCGKPSVSIIDIQLSVKNKSQCPTIHCSIVPRSVNEKMRYPHCHRSFIDLRLRRRILDCLPKFLLLSHPAKISGE